MHIEPFVWLLAVIGFLVLEALTVNMTSIWFAIGSAAALISCLAVQSFRVQSIIFVVVSVVCLIAFKPLTARLHKAATPTNGDRNLGREAVVLTEVTAENAGRVRLDGVDWNARSNTPGEVFAPGEHCRVVSIQSTLLLVERISAESRKA